MGLPDLPGQPEDDTNFKMDEHNTIRAERFSEDESDNESIRRTSLTENETDSVADATINEDESSTVDQNSSLNSELCNIDVWNAPRPDELSIEIDSSKAAEIVTVMAGIKLPTTAVPDWAHGVPEEEWKENLLQRIRQRQQPDVTDGCGAFCMESASPSSSKANGNSSSGSSDSKASRRT
ncbi:uncharacterized protein LOC128722954 isoform X2 [Anopheles nili]|uniref:uncharacterized protein LOC128722954 isoform X2 n=1 Tax=Anopheles nili TaxID=185578 RepID=UPI00237BBFFA|nr:uncharacterized protein LOC128722954 isoform X2 [Anopheles nili]